MINNWKKELMVDFRENPGKYKPVPGHKYMFVAIDKNGKLLKAQSKAMVAGLKIELLKEEDEVRFITFGSPE